MSKDMYEKPIHEASKAKQGDTISILLLLLLTITSIVLIFAGSTILTCSLATPIIPGLDRPYLTDLAFVYLIVLVLLQWDNIQYVTIFLAVVIVGLATLSFYASAEEWESFARRVGKFVDEHYAGVIVANVVGKMAALCLAMPRLRD